MPPSSDVRQGSLGSADGPGALERDSTANLMNLFRARFVFIAALACCVSTTYADGFYVGIGGFARRYDLSPPDAAQGSSSSGYSLSGKLFAGYEFTSAWSVEGGYVGFGKPAYSYTQNGATGALSTGGRAWFVAAKSSMRLDEQFELFGKIGLARHAFEVTGSGAAASLTEDRSTTALYLGAGAQVNISKNMASTLEFEHFGTDNKPGSPLNGVSLNLQYKF